MPRKTYDAHCSYCKRSKLTDPQFEAILWYYIQGASAEETRHLMLRDIPEMPPLSEKTVRRYFRRIGEAICNRFFLPFEVQRFKVEEQMKSDPEECLSKFEEAAEMVHDTLMSLNDKKRPVEVNPGPKQRLGHSTTTYLKLSASRYGVSGSKLEHVAFAFFKDRYERLLQEKFGVDQGPWANNVNMLILLKHSFKTDPV